MLTGMNAPVCRVACDTSTANTISISGTVVSGLSHNPMAVGVKFYVGGSVDGTVEGDDSITGGTVIPVTSGSDPAMIGLDETFECFPTKGAIDQGFFVNDEFNADQSFDLTDADVTFSMVINYGPSVLEEDWITGSMTFHGLNMLDQAAMNELADIAGNMVTEQIAIPDPGSVDQYQIGLKAQYVTTLANMGAIVSLKNPEFNASAVSDFTVAGVGSQTGTASAITFDDATDTLTFNVTHFSDYKVSRNTDLQAHIDQAKTMIGTSFSAIQGIDSNILTRLESLPGMSATGVDLSLLSKTPSDSDPTPLPVTLANGNITYNSNSHSGSVTLKLSYSGLTDSAILTVNIPENDVIAPVPGNSGTITASSVGSNSLVLNWTAASDSITPTTALEYHVVKSTSNNINTGSEMEGNGTLLTDDPVANMTSYSAVGLSPSTTYYFNIAVRDRAGKWNAYTSLGVTTSALSGGGGGGGGNTPVVPAAPAKKTITNENTVTSTTTVTGTMDAVTGKTTAALTNDSFKPMLEDAKKAESSEQQAIVEIKVDSGSAAKEIAVDIPKTAFKQLAGETKAQVSLTSSLGTVTFDEQAVQAINEAAANDIQISIAKVDNTGLSSDIQALVGSAPVYDFTVKSGGSNISEFGSGNAAVSVPYTLAEGDNPNAVVVYYINDSGALETVRGAYDPDTKTVKFVTGHFSKYAIAYNEVNFNDVKETAWYKNAVDFIAARGITTGTDENSFSPNAKLTRAQLLVMIMKAYGIEPAADATDNFIDAGNSWYTGYLAKAKELGLASGDGNNQYGPNKNITRQDMFTLLYRTLEVLGDVPEATTDKTLSGFLDAGSVKAYAKAPMETFLAAGVITGNYDMLTPQGASTRAEMAQLLFNLLSK